MAVPKKKVSRGRKRRRQSHMALSRANWGRCPHCNAPKLPHSVCLCCGFIKEREVLRERGMLKT